jgi:DNA polymerase I-like protein with 3'-5' exonuclease and polymerase domains
VAKTAKTPKPKKLTLKDSPPDREGVESLVVLPPPRRDCPNLFVPTLVDCDDVREEMYDRLQNADRVTVDTETTGLKIDRDQIIGVCLAVPPWDKGYYIPMYNSPEGSIWYKDWRTFDRMRAFLKGFLEWDIPKIFHNALYDVPIIYLNLGIAVRNIAGDTMLKSHVVDAESEHGLKENAVKRIHPEADWYEGELKRYNQAVGGSEDNPLYWKLPARKVADYGSGDAVFTGRLDDLFEHPLNTVPDLRKVYEEIALPLTRELIAMRVGGIPLDKQFLENGHTWYSALLEKVTDEIREMVNDPELNPGSTVQLNELLFNKLGLRGKRKTKTGYSTDEDSMKGLKGQHPIVEKILEYREVQKLDSTYYVGLLEDIGPDGVFRPDIKQIGARTGRLSMSRIHQIPRLSPLGDILNWDPKWDPDKPTMAPLVRDAFIAPDGWVIVGGDQSQLEARVLAHYSQDPELMRIYREGLDVHCATAKLMFDLPCSVSEVKEKFPQKRQDAKTINFALLYLETIGGLARQLECDWKTAEGYYKKFFEIYAGIPKWAAEEISIAKQLGYVKMLSGRRRYLPELKEQGDLPKPAKWPPRDERSKRGVLQCFAQPRFKGGIGLSLEFDLSLDLKEWTRDVANTMRPVIEHAKKERCGKCEYLWQCYYNIEYDRIKKALEHNERQALNTKIQGSAADLVGLGIIRTGQLINQHGYDARFIIYVHDEVHWLVPQDSNVDLFAKDFSKAMMSVDEYLDVPLLFEAKAAKQWSKIK